MAEENSGKLVARVRRQAKLLADENKSDFVLIDGAPGVGCPVISSITGADAVLIVTEPTLSGLHDLERVSALSADHFGISTFVCVNKYDLNSDMTDKIETYCHEKNINFVGKIPYDNVVTEAMVKGKSVIEYSDSVISKAVSKLWTTLTKLISEN